MATALELVQRACWEANIPAPTSLVSQTSPSILQLINLFYSTGRELREARYFPELKKKHIVRLNSGQERYPLPEDFYAAIPETNWDKQNQWQMQGPLSDGMWNARLYGYITIDNRKAFRIFGPDINPSSGGGQFQISPTPGDAEQGTELTFEYISLSWMAPPLWVAGASYGADAYSFCYGNVYKKGSGTSNAGTVPPNLSYNVGRDGGMEWLALPSVSAWGATTAYPAGRFVTNSGNLYECVVGGISAGSGGPTGTTTNVEIVDGTAQWEYHPVLSWTAQTEYEEGDIILISAQYYVAQNGAKSGLVSPTWTETTVSDGTIIWTYISAPYDTIITDDDLVLLEDDLMIMGLKWRFMQARGVGYKDLRIEYERSKNAAVARYMPGMKFNLAGQGYYPAGLYPNFPLGNFGS